MDIAFPPLGQGICDQFTLLLTTSQHLMYTSPLINSLAGSKYIRDVFILYMGNSAELPSRAFSSHLIRKYALGNMSAHYVLFLAFGGDQHKLPVKIVAPFFNPKEQTVVPLPETPSAAFLYVGEDSVLPKNISDIDFAYEVILPLGIIYFYFGGSY